MNTMRLAWKNARAAKRWHGVGTQREYFAGSLRLAHKGVDLGRAIYRRFMLTALTTLAVSAGYGVLLAYVCYIMGK